MTETEKDYEELFALLNKHKARYCIVGAYAVAFHALPRYTKDIDLLVEPSLENGRKIVRALDDFGFRSLGLSPADFCQFDQVIQLGYEPIRIDILTSIAGLTFKEAWDNKERGKYGNVAVHFIGRRELIKNKQAANRKQDQADLLLLKRSRKRPGHAQN